jgi:hypothetical protein
MMTAPQRRLWLYKGRWRRALPLPWHTRLRLRVTRWRDNAAYWLVCHVHPQAGAAVWRLTGAWRRRGRVRAT